MMDRQDGQATSALLEAAHNYHRLGWSIFPVQGHGEDGKKPLMLPDGRRLRWLQYQTVRASEEQVQRWWTEHPEAGIALVLGTASSVVALDLDGEGAVGLAAEHGIPLAPTACSRTGGGGLHYVYRCSDSLPTRNPLVSDGNGSHIEFRAEGSYILLPPSKHPSGSEYEWVTDLDELTDLPDVTRALAQGDGERRTPASPVTNVIPAGQRNCTLTSLAGTMRRRGMSSAEIQAALQETNRHRCRPPLAPREVESIARSVGKYEPAEDFVHRVELAPSSGPRQADPTMLLDALPERGFLRDYLHWVRPCTDAPPHFHVIAGLVCVSAALGHRCFVDTGAGIFPNLYAVLVAPSTRSRKTTVVNFARRLLDHLTVEARTGRDQVEDQSVVLPADFSVEGLFQTLSQRPTGVIVWSELGAALASFGRSYMQGAAELFTDLYDCPPRVVRALRREQIAIEQPCVSVFAGTTPEWLTQHVTETTAVAGFLPRFIFAGAEHPGQLLELPPPLDREAELRLAASLDEIRQGYQQEQAVPVSVEAIRQQYGVFARRLDGKRSGGQSQALRDAFVTRLTTTSLKLALLFEAADNAGSTAISLGSWRRAESVTDYLCSYVDVLLDRLTWTEWERWRQKALDSIRDAGASGITRNALSRTALRGLEKRRRDSLLDAVLEEGVVVTREGAGGGGGPKPQTFVAVEFA